MLTFEIEENSRFPARFEPSKCRMQAPFGHGACSVHVDRQRCACSMQAPCGENAGRTVFFHV